MSLKHNVFGCFFHFFSLRGQVPRCEFLDEHAIQGDIVFGRQSNRPPRRITEKSLAESFPAEC